MLSRFFKRGLQTSHLLSQTAFTADRYPINRNPNFTKLNKTHLEYFSSIISNPAQNVISSDDIEATNINKVDQSDLDQYNTDWLSTVKGQSKLVLKPKTSSEVSAVLKYCNDNNIAVCPQGGNTGLCGGSNPVFDEVILSLARMNKVENIDSVSGIVKVEAGVVLENLMNTLADHEPSFIVPLDLGAKGSCHIGGNISTNAGGLRVLRYGSLHGSVLGLEVVLPDGRILDVNSPLRKDNTGLDLKQLFIGAEGSLGIVTKATILCPNQPKSTNLAVFQLESYEKVLELFSKAKENLAEILSAFEFLDSDSRVVVRDNLKIQNPFESTSDSSHFFVVLETQGSNDTHDKEKLENFISLAMEEACVSDGVLADEPSKIRELWSLRENIAMAVNVDGYVWKYDVSISLSKLYQCVEDVRARLSPLIEAGKATRITGYGHVGDGNLHINVTAKEYDPEVTKVLEPFIYEWVSDVGGSVSAEHGLGFKKPQFIGLSKSDVAIDVMKDIKKVFDPKGILNPYKYLPGKDTLQYRRE